jgi:hypothetical protein
VAVNHRDAALEIQDPKVWAKAELEKISAASETERVRRSPWWAGRRKRRGRSAFWFRAQYLLAADDAHRQLDRWLRRPESEWTDREEALEATKQLAEKIEEGLAEKPAGREAKAFQSFLLDIEASALIMWAGVRLVAGQTAGQTERQASLQGLTGIDLHRRLEGAVHEAAVSTQTVIDVCLRTCRMSARARYNLACFNAVAAMVAGRPEPPAPSDKEAAVGSQLRFEAAARLQLQLAAPGLPRSTLDWASRDPCLQQLRQSDRAKFDALVRPSTSGPTSGGPYRPRSV